MFYVCDIQIVRLTVFVGFFLLMLLGGLFSCVVGAIALDVAFSRFDLVCGWVFCRMLFGLDFIMLCLTSLLGICFVDAWVFTVFRVGCWTELASCTR